MNERRLWRLADMKFNQSLRLRFVLFFGVFLLVLCGVMTLFSINQMKRLASDTFANEGDKLVERARSLIDVDAFIDLTQSLDAKDPRYTKMREAMLTLKQDSSAK
jgi:hypothetical protein